MENKLHEEIKKQLIKDKKYKHKQWKRVIEKLKNIEEELEYIPDLVPLKEEGTIERYYFDTLFGNVIVYVPWDASKVEEVLDIFTALGWKNYHTADYVADYGTKDFYLSHENVSGYVKVVADAKNENSTCDLIEVKKIEEVTKYKIDCPSSVEALEREKLEV